MKQAKLDLLKENNNGNGGKWVLLGTFIVIVLMLGGVAVIWYGQTGRLGGISASSIDRLADLPTGQFPANDSAGRVAGVSATDTPPLKVNDPSAATGTNASGTPQLTDQEKADIEAKLKQQQEELNTQAKELGKNVVTIFARDYEFSKKEIHVKKGDKVKVILASLGGSHDWVLEGYDVRTSIVSSGQGTSVEFTADKAGTFTFYSSVDDQRSKGMVGEFIVEE